LCRPGLAGDPICAGRSGQSAGSAVARVWNSISLRRWTGFGKAIALFQCFGADLPRAGGLAVDPGRLWRMAQWIGPDPGDSGKSDSQLKLFSETCCALKSLCYIARSVSPEEGHGQLKPCGTDN